MSRTSSTENRELRRIGRYKKKAMRSSRKMIRRTHQAAYYTSLANFYAMLCSTNNWETMDEILAAFRYEIDKAECEGE